ncbi:MAG: hypothetical protein ACP5M9_04345 [Candidatus Micrarchaeia archaeon]
MESLNNMENRKTGFEIVKLVKAEKVDFKLFSNVDKRARKVIGSSKPNQLLLLRITMNSPLSLVEAKLFDKIVFEDLLKQSVSCQVDFGKSTS